MTSVMVASGSMKSLALAMLHGLLLLLLSALCCFMLPCWSAGIGDGIVLFSRILFFVDFPLSQLEQTSSG